eukprot:3144552-Pleurochrysis_carterae.AAC.1
MKLAGKRPTACAESSASSASSSAVSIAACARSAACSAEAPRWTRLSVARGRCHLSASRLSC